MELSADAGSGKDRPGTADRQCHYREAIVSQDTLATSSSFGDKTNVLIGPYRPFTPYCGLKLVELAQQFFPPGVVQSLSGDDNLGPWLTSHPGIDKISFTGSTNTGKAVMQSASKTLKRVTLEL